MWERYSNSSVGIVTWLQVGQVGNSGLILNRETSFSPKDPHQPWSLQHVLFKGGTEALRFEFENIYRLLAYLYEKWREYVVKSLEWRRHNLSPRQIKVDLWHSIIGTEVGVWGINLRMLNCGVRFGWVVIATLRPFYLRKEQHPEQTTLGEPQVRCARICRADNLLLRTKVRVKNDPPHCKSLQRSHYSRKVLCMIDSDGWSESQLPSKVDS